MFEERALKKVYSACDSEGSFIRLAKVDTSQIKTMMDVAIIDFESVKGWAKTAPKESGQWNAIFKLHYDVLHELIEAFLIFYKLKVRSHECLFAYFCEKHPEIEFDWNFLEKIRTKRNRSIYYGRSISYQDWREVELQLNLYISTMKKLIETKLKDS